MDRRCTVCKLIKPASEFYNSHTSGKRYGKHQCKVCERSRSQTRYRKNAKRMKETRYGKTIQRLYGITQSEYDDRWIAQNGLCPVCHQKPNDKLHIDHCHKTGKVRGLLCRKCNLGLGYFEDDILRLENAIKYLQKHR